MNEGNRTHKSRKRFPLDSNSNERKREESSNRKQNFCRHNEDVHYLESSEITPENNQDHQNYTENVSDVSNKSYHYNDTPFRNQDVVSYQTTAQTGLPLPNTQLQTSESTNKDYACFNSSTDPQPIISTQEDIHGSANVRVFTRNRGDSPSSRQEYKADQLSSDNDDFHFALQQNTSNEGHVAKNAAGHEHDDVCLKKYSKESRSTMVYPTTTGNKRAPFADHRTIYNERDVYKRGASGHGYDDVCFATHLDKVKMSNTILHQRGDSHDKHVPKFKKGQKLDDVCFRKDHSTHSKDNELPFMVNKESIYMADIEGSSQGAEELEDIRDAGHPFRSRRVSLSSRSSSLKAPGSLNASRIIFSNLVRDYCGLGMVDAIDWRPSRKSVVSACVDKCFDVLDELPPGVNLALDVCYIDKMAEKDVVEKTQYNSRATNTPAKNLVDTAISVAVIDELEEEMEEGFWTRCLHYLFIIICTLELMMGLALFSLGLWMLIRMAIVRLLLLELTFIVTTMVFITNGLLLIAAGILGLYGVLRPKYVLLIFHIIFATIMAITLLCNGYLQSAYQVTTEYSAEYIMKTSMPYVTNNKSKSVADAWTMLQHSLHCCGVHGYLDWCIKAEPAVIQETPLPTINRNLTMYEEEEDEGEEYVSDDNTATFNYTTCYLLPGCCKDYKENLQESDCVNNPTPYNIHTMGCKKPVVILISYTGTIFRATFVGGAMVGCTSAILALYIYGYFRYRREWWYKKEKRYTTKEK